MSKRCLGFTGYRRVSYRVVVVFYENDHEFRKGKNFGVQGYGGRVDGAASVQANRIWVYRLWLPDTYLLSIGTTFSK